MFKSSMALLNQRCYSDNNHTSFVRQTCIFLCMPMQIFRNLLPLKAKQEPKLPDDFGDYHSDEAKQLVLSMTSFDHTVRPSIEEILKRDFHQYSEKLASSAVKEA